MPWNVAKRDLTHRDLTRRDLTHCDFTHRNLTHRKWLEVRDGLRITSWLLFGCKHTQKQVHNLPDLRHRDVTITCLNVSCFRGSSMCRDSERVVMCRNVS